MNNDFNIVKGILEQNGELTGLAFGNSMKPLLRSGKDNAVIVPLPDTLKVNDVILYRNTARDELVLHRIIKIWGDGFVIRGDNLYINETTVNKSDMLGILKGFYRNGKYRDCNQSTAYKLYVFCLRASYPIRFLIHKAISLLKRIIRKITYKKTVSK